MKIQWTHSLPSRKVLCFSIESNSNKYSIPLLAVHCVNVEYSWNTPHHFTNSTLITIRFILIGAHINWYKDKDSKDSKIHIFKEIIFFKLIIRSRNIYVLYYIDASDGCYVHIKFFTYFSYICYLYYFLIVWGRIYTYRKLSYA